MAPRLIFFLSSQEMGGFTVHRRAFSFHPHPPTSPLQTLLASPSFHPHPHPTQSSGKRDEAALPIFIALTSEWDFPLLAAGRALGNHGNKAGSLRLFCYQQFWTCQRGVQRTLTLILFPLGGSTQVPVNQSFGKQVQSSRHKS